MLILKYKSHQLSYEAPFQIIVAVKKSFACSCLKKKLYFYLSVSFEILLWFLQMIFFFAGKKNRRPTQQRQGQDKQSSDCLWTKEREQGKKRGRVEIVASSYSVHWFPIPISVHLPVHRDTDKQQGQSFKWELVCLYSLYCATECLFHYIGQQRPDRRAYRKQVSGYLGGQIRVGSGHKLRLFDCASDALGQYGQLRTLMLVAVVTDPACARCETTCFHCHCMTQAVQESKATSLKKPLVQSPVSSYNPPSALSSPLCLTSPHFLTLIWSRSHSLLSNCQGKEKISTDGETVQRNGTKSWRQEEM